MITGEENLRGDQVSVSWEGGTPVKGDPSLERAAAFAAVLAKTLSSAGFHARQLRVAVSRETPGGVLQLTAVGDVPGMSEPDFEALAQATMNGVSSRLGFSFEDDLVLTAKLQRSGVVAAPLARVPVRPEPTPEPEGKRRRRGWFFLGRLAVGLGLGLLLGVLGLPRLQPSIPSLPTAEPRLVPTVPPPKIINVRDLSTPEATDAQPTAAPPTVVPTAAVTTRSPSVLVNERFAAPPAKWPNDPNGSAWFASGEYRLFARDPGRFVSVGVPMPDVPRMLQVSAQFHKVEGPAGGGYGLIVRDQGTQSDRDGRNQTGQYLVLEVDDRGDVGIWQRDQTRWIDVVPWTYSEAVHVDHAPNTLTVNADGAKVRFEVNGVQVVDLTYDRLPPIGRVGIFVGGDLNLVALQWLRIETS